MGDNYIRHMGVGIVKMFPKTKFVKENGIWEQIKHIESEVEEVVDAFDNIDLKTMDLHDFKLELIDVKHSVDTLLHILGVDEEENMRLSNEAIKKNYDRGYYKTKKEA